MSHQSTATAPCQQCGEAVPPSSRRRKFCSVLCRIRHAERVRPKWDGSVPRTAHCFKCKTDKDRSEFHSNKKRPSGLSAWCKACRRQYDIDHPGQCSEGQRRYRRAKRATKLVGCIRQRARKCGIPYDLEDRIADIQARIDAGRCEMSGVPFDLDGYRTFNTPSIDRIDPAKGYVYGNIRIVCLAMNCALNSWGEGPLLQVMRAWIARVDSEGEV